MRALRVLVGVLCCVCSTAYAAVPNDWDGDGVSDLTRIEEQSDKSLTWKAVLSTSGATTTVGALGTSSDQVAMAQWLPGGTQIGVVSVNSSANTLTWSILDSSAAKIDKTFGKSGDLIIAGADLNGNATADAVVVRLVNGAAQWEVAYDLFASAESKTETVTFGKSGDRVFFARVEGTATDWIGVVGKGSRGRSLARMRNMVTGEIRQFKRFPKFASKGARPRAFAIRQSSGADLLGFQYAKGSGTQIATYTWSGARVSDDLVSGVGTSVVGDFNAGDGQEIAYQHEAESVIINPMQGEAREVSYLGGTAVDEINVGVVGSTTSSDSSSGGSSRGSSGGGSGPLSQCSQIASWPGGYIYKTIGSNHFTDVRRNTVGVIIKPGARGPFPSCVQVLDSKGNVVAKLSLYQKGAGWAARYYAGIGCASGTPFNGASVAAKAQANTGSSSVYMNFGGICYGPINASQCLGSRHC